MRLLSGLLVLIMLFGVACLPGCGGASDAAAASPLAGPRKITFNIVNQTGKPMTSIGVLGAERPMGFRDLKPGSTGSISHSEPHVPEWLELNWSDDRGNRFAGKVYVWTELGQSFGGDLTLVVSRRNKVTLRGD